MSFFGRTFCFDDKMSEIYDLRILDFNPSNPTNSPTGGEVSIKEEWIYRLPKPYFYGRYYQSVLEFDFTVGSFNYIDGQTRHAIESWLIGRSTYLPLRIVQDDIEDVVYNCIITKSTQNYVGNLNYGLNLHAVCSSPWAEKIQPTLTKTYAGGLSTETFSYLNSSAYNGYNRPTITFTMDATATYFSIINASDNNREFRFDALSPLETITVDNERGIITSSIVGQLRIANFNKNFLRLIQGINNLTLSGYITNFTLDTTFFKGVGA